MEGDARRISYQALGKGVPVRASGGEEIGTVEHVLQVPELDVFDGIVLWTAAGLRFADADQVADITEHARGSLHDWFGRMFGRGHWK
jgi:uncharacterized Fe-S cluster-containing radical SAM superfamily protein